MTFRAWALAGTASLMALSGVVSVHAQVADPQMPESQPTAAPTSVFMPPIPAVPPLDERAREALSRAVKGEQRIDAQRDRWRNPEATLQFFGVRPSDTVVEIWPGQGWYTSILGPYLKQGDGRLIVGHFDAASSNSQVVRQIVDAYRARFATDTAVYGNVNVVAFGPRSMPMAPPNSVDKVLTFRNIHNWMAQGWAEKAFADFYTVLKPGGILGIEEHRGRTDEPQDPLARDGYVREDYVIQMAREAGFEFIGGAEINANPADTKDHPFGVWTLPPVSRTSPIGQMDDPGFDRSRYDEIGESDRMTLRFRKPLDATGVGLASSRPTADQIPVTIIPGPPPPPPAPRRGRRGAPPPPPPAPVPTPAPGVAATESRPAVVGAAPVVDAKEGGTTASASGLRPATGEPQAKAPPAPPPPAPAATGRRGGATKARAPATATAPAAAPVAGEPARPVAEATSQPSPAPDPKPKAEPPAAGTATTPLRPRQRGTSAAAPKAGEPAEAASKTKTPAASGRAGLRETEPAAAAGAATKSRSRPTSASAAGEEPKTKSGAAASGSRTPEEPAAPSRRNGRRPAAETDAPASKSKSKAKASETETARPASSRNRNRQEPKAEPKKKAESKNATSSSKAKASPKAAPKASSSKKSPPPAKANPNKPDWVVPPKKKKE